MGSRVSQDTTCWTDSLSSHEVKAGTMEEERKGKFQGPSGTAEKLRVRGSKSNSTAWSSEIGLPGANVVDVVLQSQVLALHRIPV